VLKPSEFPGVCFSEMSPNEVTVKEFWGSFYFKAPSVLLLFAIDFHCSLRIQGVTGCSARMCEGSGGNMYIKPINLIEVHKL